MKDWPRQFWVVIICSLLFISASSANASSLEYVQQHNYSSYDEAGFFSGIWHGLLAPYSLIIRWFVDVDMYAYVNTGWFYDFGFLLGLAGSLPIGWLIAMVAMVAMIV